MEDVYSNPVPSRDDFHTNASPIFGPESSILIRNKAHYTINNDTSHFGPLLQNGFSIYFEIQPDTSFEEYVVLGYKSESGTCLIIHYNADKVPKRLKLTLVDDDSKRLIGHTQLNFFAAKSIFVVCNPDNNNIQIHEKNTIDLDSNRPVEYLHQEKPESFLKLQKFFKIF